MHLLHNRKKRGKISELQTGNISRIRPEIFSGSVFL